MTGSHFSLGLNDRQSFPPRTLLYRDTVALECPKSFSLSFHAKLLC